MGLMPPTDAMFMVAESREQPMHVGALQLFTPPEGADVTYVTRLYEDAVQATELTPLFRKRPHRGPKTLGQWTWTEDEDVDLEHHVRHSALPHPGRMRELLSLTSRLHGTLLDRHRPLWEAHLVEGLADGRFAVYTKLHHAMMDGVSGLRLLQRSLSTDPDERSTPMPWEPRPDRQRTPRPSTGLSDLPGVAARAALDTATLGPKVLGLAVQALREQTLALPFQAPRSMLNVRITGSRRFAGDAWELERLRKVGAKADATVNDVVVAMCSGALRRYLLEQDALPDSPLVAMVPISLRNDDSAEGNAVGTILCNLGTHLADPEQRLLAVRDSMRQGKQVFQGLSQLQATALSAAVMLPLLLDQLPGVDRVARPPYNLVISNVPGPPEHLYWNGARLDGLYPLSIPLTGQALNITVTSYAGEMQFGLTGDRRSLPSLQRLLVHLDDTLAEMEAA